MPGLVVGTVATEGLQGLLRTNVRGYDTLLCLPSPIWALCYL